jgi:hypothetical protein
MAMTELPNTVTEAQMRLRQDMHGSIEWQVRSSTDPEWLRRQLSPDIIVPPSRTAKRVALLVVAMVIGGIVLGMCAAGRAAEVPGRFEIVAYPAGRDLREDRPNLIVISGPYAGREECRIAIASVKLANGNRLRCDRIEDRRVK